MTNLRLSASLLLFGVLIACSDLETKYFKDRVSDVTAGQVAEKYGPPHRVQRDDGGYTVWTYFERGSGTASYAGTAKGGICRAYQLSFDQQDILRNWVEIECQD